jgi:putative flavoprotein involved in K+ transport
MIRPLENLAAGSVDVLIIGAGHSGLAMSRFLTGNSVDHVVLERGEVANSWKHERWDSLQLLTPNWLCRLPGYQYSGPDPDGYMTMNEVVDFIQGYADFSQAPVRTGTEVTLVQRANNGYRVMTNRGEWHTRTLVIASGAFNKPSIPAVSKTVPDSIRQITPHDYRNTDQLEEGGVMVVGGSATGLQLAAEIQASGRPVTLAVGEHVRMPRVYRGRDIQYWMKVSGVLDECYDEIDDIQRARRVPSPQLVGSDDRRNLDINALMSTGVRVTGRLAGIRNGKAQFSGSLRNVCKLADLKMNRLLKSIDDWVSESGREESTHPAERFAPTEIADAPCFDLDLINDEIRTIVWATGFRPDYSWLDVPVFDRKGQIQHDGGIADDGGMIVMGLPYLRRRKSSFIHGAEDDARDLGEHLVRHLRGTTSGIPLRAAS